MNIWLAATVTVLLFGIGCGGPDYGDPVSVSGKVTSDGEPLTQLTVIFHSSSSGLPAEMRTQRATTDDQGVYRLEQVYPGDYTILFEKAAAAPENPGMAPAVMDDSASPWLKYSGDNALTASVTDSATDVNFELDSNQ